MYELWAKKRAVNGKGFPYEFILSFENKDFQYSAIDKLDPSIYKEAIIIDENHSCMLYREFPDVKVLKIGPKRNN